MEPDAAEIRVLGCLIEKQRTTPDVYPLTLNALRLACNQSTNRDPVVDYGENEVRAALEGLVQRKWATLASWSNRRTMKYRHKLDMAVGLDDAEISLLCVLMLRGPQTPGELKSRTERLHPFAGVADVQSTLEHLIERRLVERLERRPGQREDRYRQLLGGGEGERSAPAAAGEAAAATTAAADAGAEAAPVQLVERTESELAEPVERPASALTARVERLEDELAELRSQLDALREELGA